MKKLKFSLGLVAITISAISQNWTTSSLNSFAAGVTPRIGTSSESPMAFWTSGSARMTLATDGSLKINDLAGSGDRILVVDANGTLKTANYSSPTSCNSVLPWFLGGNTVTNGLHTIGTCNDVDFILKANNNPALFIKGDGKIGIGINNSSPGAQLDIWDPLNSNPNHFRIHGDVDGTVESTGNISLWMDGTFSIRRGTINPLNIAGNPFYIDANDLTHMSSASISANLAVGVYLDVYGNTKVSGKVGIGGSVGTEQLEVIGTTKITGNVGIGAAPGTEKLEVTGNTKITGKVGIGGSPTSQELEVTGNTKITGNLGVGAANPLEKFHVSGGNARFDGRIGINTPATAAYNLEISDPAEAWLMIGSSSSLPQQLHGAKLGVGNPLNTYLFRVDDTQDAIGHISRRLTVGQEDIINFHMTGWGPQYAQAWVGKRPPSNVHPDFNFAAEKIVATSIHVVSGNGWADYVFADDYQLPKLYDVELFYKTNKHLPEIPSAKDVEEKGIDVGEMNKLLLKKVEELTLYLVEQQKKHEELEKQVRELKLLSK